MKKVVQTNIGGRHFFMDEDAYQVMNEYLDSLKAHFEKEKEVANEIIGDIEQRMAELLESRITDGKKVISLEDVQESIRKKKQRMKRSHHTAGKKTGACTVIRITHILQV